MSKFLPFIALCASLVFCAYSVGHHHGREQSDGLGELAAANDRLAGSYEKLAAQLSRINH